MSAKEPELWIVVDKWNKFQHYPNRAVWIKNYVQLLSDRTTDNSPAQRSTLHGLWLMYAANNRQIPEHVVDHATTRRESHEINTRSAQPCGFHSVCC